MNETSRASAPVLAPGAVALICAAVAFIVALTAAWTSMWSAGGGTSALIRIPKQEPLGRYVTELHDDWTFVEPATRYDGLYYYAIAQDPLAKGEQHTLIDAPAYRYGHPGHGWLAAMVSLGSEARLPAALLLLGLAGMAAAAWALSRLAVLLGASPWLGLFVAVNPGLIYAVTVDTPESTGIAVMGLGLVAYLRKRVWVAGALFVLLCLIKEAFVFVPMGLGIFELVRHSRGERDPDLLYKLGILALGPLALAAWFVYLHGQLGLWPFAEGPENITLPVVGFVETLRFAAIQQNGAEFQLGQASLPLLLALAAGMIAGLVRSLRMRSPLDPIFALSAALIFCLSWLALLYPKDMWRNISILTYLAPLVFLARVPWAGKGQLEIEGGPASGIAVDPDAPVVPLDDQPGEVKA